MEGFTGGDAEIQRGLNRMWADKANWPSEERARFDIPADVEAFIVAAIKT